MGARMTSAEAEKKCAEAHWENRAQRRPRRPKPGSKKSPLKRAKGMRIQAVNAAEALREIEDRKEG